MKLGNRKDLEDYDERVLGNWVKVLKAYKLLKQFDLFNLDKQVLINKLNTVKSNTKKLTNNAKWNKFSRLLLKNRSAKINGKWKIIIESLAK